MRNVPPGRPARIRTNTKSAVPSPASVRDGRLRISDKTPTGIWRKCHEMLDAITPLRTDCGALCGARCCHGGPGDGMLLFPEEALLYAELFTAHSAMPALAAAYGEESEEHAEAPGQLSSVSNPDGWRITDSRIILPGTREPVRLLICGGSCIRRLRPMACRIFPLLPWIDRHGRMRIRPDMRAYAVCPLLSQADAPPIDPAFARAVLEAMEAASALPGTRLLLESLNDEASLLRKFHGLDV